jgi:hypothetical protein
MPCPIRDHHREFRRLLTQSEPDPTDHNALEALSDDGYARGLAEYDESYRALSDPIWRDRYLRVSHKNEG